MEPGDDALQALSWRISARASRLIVLWGDKLLGIIFLKDILEFPSLTVDLKD